MKSVKLFIVLFWAAIFQADANSLKQSSSSGFTENKGQFTDSNNEPVPFVLFKATAPGMDMYVTEKGLTCVFSKVEKEKKDSLAMKRIYSKSRKISTEMSWTNIRLQGAIIKEENIVREGASSEHFNFFYPHCSEGIYDVKQYEKITIKEVYPGIDWVLYGHNEKGVKYDFIVHRGANPDMIKVIYEGENPVSITASGGIEVKTRLGALNEQSPESFINNRSIASRFKHISTERMHHGGYESTIGFDVSCSLDEITDEHPLIIDPALVWATFYGGTVASGSDADGPMASDIDINGNLVVTGYTSSTNFPAQNSAGAYYQGALASAGTYDIFILKFNNTGTRLWATYYGGSSWDVAYFISTDGTGNIFVTGSTESTNFPVQNSGTFFQGTKGGSGANANAFIVKFNNAGTRQWATYYGGSDYDVGNCITADASGNVFVAGQARSANFPTQTAGTFFQGTQGGSGSYDIFLLKFDNAGNRLWATYYGGSDQDIGISITTDGSGNAFVTGITYSANFPVQNAGTFFQGALAGVYDVFILKFDNAGNRLWATYYGGTIDYEIGTALATDASGNLFVTGWSVSGDFPLLNSGTYFQGTLSGSDVFILKFDNAGTRLWATFYGGSGNDGDSQAFDNLVIDNCNNVYIGCLTESTNFPTQASCDGAFLNSTFNGGQSDIGLVAFSNTGTRLWATYVGGDSRDFRTAMAVDANNNLFVVGEWVNLGNTATYPLTNPGGGAYYDATYNGGDDGYILKFNSAPCMCTSILSVAVVVQHNLCNAQCIGTATATPSAGTPPYTYAWSTTATTQSITGLCAGNYSVIITDASSATVTATVIVTEPTVLTATATSTAASCGGNNGSATANGGGGTPGYTYSWNTTPTQTTQTATGLGSGDYTATITDANGCTQTQTVTITSSGTFSVNATSTPAGCTSSNGTAIATANGGSVPYTYSWNNGQTNQTATGLAAGTYTAVITDANGCTGTQTVTVTSAGTVSVTLASTQTGCSSNNGTATATGSSGTAPYTYSWNNGQTTQTATGLAAGTYTATVTDSAGCTQTQTVSVTQTPGTPASVTAAPASILLGDSTTLSASGGGTYQWSPSTGLSCITCQNPIAIPTETTIYCVTVTDTNNCTDTACITVSVIIEPTDCSTAGELYLPNAFSPNNDQENDVFQLYYGDISCIKTLSLTIYSRWGEKVFETENPAFTWNGDYQNKALDNAVFAYYLYVIFVDGEQIHKKGNVSLIR